MERRRRQHCSARPRRAMAKTESLRDSTRWSAPLPSPTITNWNSPKNLSCMKSWARARRPICSSSAFRPTIFSAIRWARTLRRCAAWRLSSTKSLAEFFNFLGHQIGLANVWMALSADHGIAPLPEFAKTLRLPAANLDAKGLRERRSIPCSRKNTRGKPTTCSISTTRWPG